MVVLLLKVVVALLVVGKAGIGRELGFVLAGLELRFGAWGLPGGFGYQKCFWALFLGVGLIRKSGSGYGYGFGSKFIFATWPFQNCGRTVPRWS